MNFRFSFDLGTNSIGWAVFEVEDSRIVQLKKTGVRIFSNRKSLYNYK